MFFIKKIFLYDSLENYIILHLAFKKTLHFQIIKIPNLYNF